MPKLAEAVEAFRVACEILDLEHQSCTGRPLSPSQALRLCGRRSTSKGHEIVAQGAREEPTDEATAVADDR